MDEQGPELLRDILGRLLVARGWSRRNERLRLEMAWKEAIGEPGAKHTRVGGLRREVLEILVDNAVLLQELAHFQKRSLLRLLRERLPGMPIKELRFRAGA
jgi:predicted nucleic acid-binding Zn ribbon protein